MSIELDALKVVKVDVEDAGSYNAAQSFPGAFLDFPYKEGSLEIATNQEMLDPAIGTVCIDAMPAAKIPGIKTCTATLTSTLHSHGQDLDGDVTPTDGDSWALARVMKAVMGGSAATTNASAQTTVQAGGSSTLVNVTTSHGARFQAGCAIGCTTSAGFEVREVASVSTDAVTVRKAFSGAPTEGTAVRGGITFYLTSDPDTSLQLVYEGRELSDRVRLQGMQGGMALTVSPGQLPEVSFSLTGATWANLSDGSDVPSCPSYTLYSPPVVSAAELLFAAHSGTTRTPIDWSALTITPNLTYAAVKSGGASETVKRMKRQRGVPVLSGSFTMPLEATTMFDTWAARTYQMLTVQLGASAGSTLLITIPKVQIVNVQRAASDSGIAGLTVSFEATEDSLGTTDLLKSAYRIHAL